MCIRDSSYAQAFDCVQCLAATDSKYHVGLLIDRECAKTLHIVVGTAVSYTHLDVYKRQQDYFERWQWGI